MDLRRAVAEALARLSAEPGVREVEVFAARNRALLTRLNRVNADMGLPAMGELDPSKRGAGDISFVAADVDGLVGLGPASDGSHTDKEAVDIPSIFKQAKRAAILMSRLAKERR